MPDDKSESYYASFVGLLAGLCVLCFIACGVCYIVYDMCPIVERLAAVGTVLVLFLFGQGVVYIGVHSPINDDKDNLTP